MQEEPKSSDIWPSASETPFASHDEQLIEEVVHETEAAQANQTDTGRLEAFSDGVFAIAITLLVLNLKVPDPNTLKGGLLAELGKQWATYLSYLISFSFILIMWANHHNLFRYIRRTDHNLLLINGFLLLFITVLPFPTSLLATYLGKGVTTADERTAGVIYAATYVLIATCFNLIWWYSSKGRRLMDRSLSTSAIQEMNRRYAFGPFTYLIAFLVAFISVPAMLAINVALALFWAWPRKAPSKH